MAKQKLPGTFLCNHGRWWWQVKLPGEKKRKSIPLKPTGAKYATRDRQTAEAIAADIYTAAVFKNKPSKNRPETIADLSGLYRHEIQHGDERGARCANEVASVTLRALVNMYGTHRVEDFAPSDLRAFRTTLIDAGLSVRTIRRKIGCIHRMFDWAVSLDYCPSSVAYGLHCIKRLSQNSRAKPARKVDPVSIRDVGRTLKYTTSIVADMIRVHLRTGMRSGELCKLRAKDIDTSGEVWIFTIPAAQAKNRKTDRVVAIGKRSQKILQPYVKCKRPDEYLFSPADSEAERLAVLATQRQTPLSCGNRAGTNRKDDPERTPGEKWDSSGYGHAVARAVRKAIAAGDISEPWTPHQLRHTAGTMVRERFGLDTAGAYLGHKDINATMIYAELAKSKAIEAARVMG